MQARRNEASSRDFQKRRDEIKAGPEMQRRKLQVDSIGCIQASNCSFAGHSVKLKHGFNLPLSFLYRHDDRRDARGFPQLHAAFDVSVSGTNIEDVYLADRKS